MYAVAALEPGDHWLSFKCSPEDFAVLVEQQEITPAKYLARAHWVSLKTPEALPRKETEEFVRRAYQLVWDRLPKKTQAELKRSNLK